MATTPSILLVEDDETLGRQVAELLAGAGFAVDWLRDVADALACVLDPHRLWILDLMLPGARALDLLKLLRSRSDVPVMVLGASSDARVRVRAFELGADDYLTTPFWPEELLARVQARLRRPTALRDGRVDVGELLLDLEARRAFARGAALELTRVEFDLLASLARRRGSAVQRAWLADQVLDPQLEGTDRTLDVHVSRLRKKLGGLASYLTTVWGVGYRLEAPEARRAASRA